MTPLCVSPALGLARGLSKWVLDVTLHKPGPLPTLLCIVMSLVIVLEGSSVPTSLTLCGVPVIGLNPGLQSGVWLNCVAVSPESNVTVAVLNWSSSHWQEALRRSGPLTFPVRHRGRGEAHGDLSLHGIRRRPLCSPWFYVR